MGIVEFVDRLVMAISEDCGFAVMRVVVRQPFQRIFRLQDLREVLRYSLELILFGSACAFRVVLAATSAGF